MSHFLRNIVIAGVAAGSAILSINSASADDKVTVGMLVCTGQGAEGHIFKATEKLTCVFQPNDKGAQTDKYVGKIEQLGIDIGKAGAGQLSWMVLAASKDAYKAGILVGKYEGVGVDVAAGVGGGANLLVGDNKAFSLQPVSVEAHEGANIAVGVSKLVLNADSK
ncbi:MULTISPECIES: DUF992 domain-containing protein [Bartonella]|uniref:DUF992 domain-containing protein n=1 Tax=Bartonella choladocola TaxID=2750995 RepID=A0A1U9MIS5_9HYPH|nr:MULTISPECIES: DUF992 domain-containing protein [Bartonella]AQT47610.1 Protein of unknown function (DUF992) [Bartonella choladocola]MBH9975781.1 DUF992 domain-containing protein [Bartonella choladocola]MBI0015388.1 DUF992 domain-containing protein [Bartonella sp. B10834G3]MBI0140954.1 DUF992 domain-containing protein [Bartonella choladocola]